MGSNQQIDIDMPRTRSDVSPGMLRRRYSVPETIMRKYRLAQQLTDSEDSGTATAPSPARRPASPASPASPSRSPSRVSCVSLQDSRASRNRCALRDREVMRRSTLLRRLWSRQGVAGPYASSGELRSSDCSTRGCPVCNATKSEVVDSCKACELNASYSGRYSSDFNYDKPIGGSQNELRYYGKMSGSWSPPNAIKPPVIQDRGCECCKRLFQYSSKENRVPNISSNNLNGPLRSPKRQRIDSHSSISRSNEMLKTAMRNSYEKMEESHKQKEALTDSITEITTTDDYSKSVSIPSASTTISSSLRTTDNDIVSSTNRGETSSEMSFRYSKSSSNPGRTSNDTSMRPATTGSNLLNQSDKTPSSSNVKKRRQSVCIYINAFDSPVAKIKFESIPNSQSLEDIHLEDNLSENIETDKNENHTPSLFSTTTKTLTSEEQTKTESRDTNDTSRDDNGNGYSGMSTDSHNTSSKYNHTSETPSQESESRQSGQYTNGTDNYILAELLPSMNTKDKNVDLRIVPPKVTSETPSSRNDSRQSGQYTNGTDNYILTQLLPGADKDSKKIGLYNNKPHVGKTNIGKIDSKQNSLSVHPKLTSKLRLKNAVETTNVEFLEIVVSETLNSSAFLDNYKNNNIPNTDLQKKTMQQEKSQTNGGAVNQPSEGRVISGKFDLDEYVSFVLIESLNSMTEQLEEINAAVEKDKQLNIVEKEIKVKMQSSGSSPIADTVIDKAFLEKVEKSTSMSQNLSKSIDFKLKEKTVCLEQSTEIKQTIGDSEKNNIISSEICDRSRNETSICNEIETNNNQAIGFFDTESKHELAQLNNNKKYEEEVGKFVMHQIQQIIQNDLKTDPNLNYTSSSVADTYPSISHIEISNVDVFIESSNVDAALDTQTIAVVPSSLTEESMSSSFLTDILQDSINSSIPDINKNNFITNVTTSSYYKPISDSLLVPRYSAYPLSDSMEVNTSSEEDILKESDTGSLVDSLEDPNSPRVTLKLSKKSKYDKRLVRGDIMTLLPENNQHSLNVPKGPIEKSESFFIAIKDNECDCRKENVVVADHMPESLKEKLIRRQRKRELKMEYIKRKRLRHTKREYGRKKKEEALKVQQAIEQDCTTIINRLLDQVADKIKEDERHNRCKHFPKVKETFSPQKNMQSKKANKVDLKKLETFKIDKYGNMCHQPPLLQDLDHHSCHEENTANVKIEHSASSKPILRNKIDINDNHDKSTLVDMPLSPDLLGPKRSYHKSEFQDGNKKVEILEIIECVESSPECLSDDNDCSKLTRWHRRSKIPIPVLEKCHRNQKNKSLQKSYRHNTSSPNRKSDRSNDKITSKVDQLIADILIDALKENGTNDSNLNFIKSPKEQYYKEFVNHWPNEINTACRRASVPLSESPSSIRFRTINTPRYTQKFEIIPEEKSSISIESSADDTNIGRPISVMRNDLNMNNSDTINHATTDTVDKNVGHSPANSPTIKSILKSNVSKTKRNTDEAFTSNDTSTKVPCSPLTKILKSACTSPIPQRKSAATSPIPHLFLDKEIGQEKQVKVFGKKSLSSKGTREGWIGFCRPNSRTPEEEGTVKSPDVIHCTVKAHR